MASPAALSPTVRVSRGRDWQSPACPPVLEGLKQPETLRTFFAAAPLFSISSATAQGPNRFIPKYAPYGPSGNLSVGKTLAQCLLMKKMAASSATFFSVTIGNDTA